MVTRRTGARASMISSAVAAIAITSVLGADQIPVDSSRLVEKIEEPPIKTPPKARYAPASDQPATNPVRAPIVSPANR